MKRAVAGIVIYKNKVLIGKKVIKAGHFVSGGWHIPGGHINKYERDEKALLREYKEETGLDISIKKKVCKCLVEETNAIITWFICSTKTPDAIPGDDLTAIKFVNKKDVLIKCDKRTVRLWPKEVIDYFNHSK